jgi:hypothetical protein
LATATVSPSLHPSAQMKNLRPDFIITVIWALGSMACLILMGMEIIHNQKIVDRLLIGIPSGSAIIMGYWFSKDQNKGPPNG